MTATRGIPAQALAAKIDEFLASRGYRAPADGNAGITSVALEAPVAFVCEEDVRTAIHAGRKVVIGEKTIITPAARDLGDSHRIFIQAAWPR